MTIRMLAVGDIHLGRRPRRMPSSIESTLPASELSPAAAWRGAVDAALDREVDAVLLAGDVVDREDDFFEAYGTLEQGVGRLAAAGVPVIAVAGNHDVQVLPRLAASIPAFKLLGAGGTWEACQVTARRRASGGVETVRIVGWSFPQARVLDSPLHHESAGAVLHAGTYPEPTIGLLHCDRDRAHSDHGPVAGRDLEAAPVDAWLLGHIHVPDALDGPRPSGYLGSLVGLDPTETGPRGPWLIEVPHAQAVRAEHIALAPLRWEALTVDCGPSSERPLGDGPVQEWFEAALPDAVQAAFRRLGPARPRALGCRLTITGRTDRRSEMLRYLDGGEAVASFWEERDGVVAFVDRIDVVTEPEVSIEALARTKDPLGLLAAKLLVLGRPNDDAERQALIDAARRRIRNVRQLGAYRLLSDADDLPDDDEVAAKLREAASTGLEALLAQTARGVGDRGSNP